MYKLFFDAELYLDKTLLIIYYIILYSRNCCGSYYYHNMHDWVKDVPNFFSSEVKHFGDGDFSRFCWFCFFTMRRGRQYWRIILRIKTEQWVYKRVKESLLKHDDVMFLFMVYTAFQWPSIPETSYAKH